MAMIESFVEALEKSLGVSCTEISLSKEWSLTGIEELRETPLQDYLKRASRRLTVPSIKALLTLFFRLGYRSTCVK
jgi:hypothetical protein